MFDHRSEGIGPFIVGKHSPGAQIKLSIDNGDLVTLKIGEVRVLIRDVEVTATGQYKGIIYAFEPSISTATHALQLEQLVEFSESQVFGCQSK